MGAEADALCGADYGERQKSQSGLDVLGHRRLELCGFRVGQTDALVARRVWLDAVLLEHRGQVLRPCLEASSSGSGSRTPADAGSPRSHERSRPRASRRRTAVGSGGRRPCGPSLCGRVRGLSAAITEERGSLRVALPLVRRPGSIGRNPLEGGFRRLGGS